MRIMFIINNLGINEPFGPMLLSAALKAKGHVTTLAVLQEEDVFGKIQHWKPDLLAYSMMSVDIRDMKKFNINLRRKTKIFTLLGGPHATFARNDIKELGVDALCLGEGEEVILEIVERLERARGLEGIPNVITSKDAPLALRNLIDDFDKHPFMDRELVYAYPQMRRFGIKGIWTSRGCLFSCPYCFNSQYNELFKGKGRIVRRRSVDAVIRETQQLASCYRTEFIRIQDDVFVYRADEWFREFSRRWPQEVGLPFYCLLRPELVTEELVFYLKKAGCFSVCMSIEAADDDIRMRMLQRMVSKEKMEEAFRIFKGYNINVYANTMLAFPFTGIEHDIASVDFAIKVSPQMPNFSIFMPYPGTKLGAYCQEQGIYDGAKDEITYGMRNMSPLACFTKAEKEAQYNLCELAIVAVKFPRLRNLIVKHLIYWKPNVIFFLIHYFFAVASYGRKIFYFRHSLIEYLDLLVRTFRHYRYDYTRKIEVNKISKQQLVVNRNTSYFSQQEKARQLQKCMEVLSV